MAIPAAEGRGQRKTTYRNSLALGVSFLAARRKRQHCFQSVLRHKMLGIL